MKQKLVKKWKKISSFFIEQADRFYRFALFFTISLALFFAIPSILLGTEKDLADTPIGVSHSINLKGITLTQLERGYNEQTHYAEILLKADGKMPEGGKLEMVASESKTEQKVSHKLIRLTENYYLIQLENIPSKWKSIVIDIGVVSPTNPNFQPKNINDLFETYGQKEAKSDEETVQDALFMNRKKVPIDNQAKPQNEEKYLEKCLRLQIEESEKLIKTNKVLIRQSENYISGLEKEIKELEAEKRYETKTEIESTNQEIQDRQSKIESYQSKISEAKANNEELNEKIIKVNEQINDYSKNEK
ncbi:hypothetical protein [Enterococcus faecium]|uniref:hypothetical protein n=1 Tax=Enterococcus faecium TaxID=1352 RepID=UPI001C2A05DA|nr:hypothetical protein [Enterococcus faecium]